VPYLLDGNNLIGSVRRTARPSEQDRDALVAEIADRLRRTRARAILFFDGPAGERSRELGSLSIRTPSTAGSSADDAILREIAAARSPRDCIVVTADRELARRARDAGARVATPEDFFARFGAASPGGGSDRDAASTTQSVEEWMRYFEDPRNRE
jgi:predicted RNA-binding protein with PIN domain